MDGFLFQASVYLAAAVIAVPIAARLGLGSVLGYLLAGIVIGPVFHLVSATDDLRHFAEFGVVMMLFIIGLELEPRALWDMRHRLVGLGGSQIVLTMLAVMAGAMLLGLGWAPALACGMVFALSSTAIVLQTLSEKGLMQSTGGRSAFSVLLTQDIAVIPMLIVLPLLAVQSTAELAADGSIRRTAQEEDVHHGLSLVEGLPGWGVALVTLAAVALIIVAGIYGARPLFRHINSARLPEMFTAVALLIVVGIAFLMEMVGLSPALGTFLAGVVLANSEFRHQLESDIEPFKGLLLGLFFITVGAGIDISAFMREPMTILGLALGLILLKGAILYGLSRMFKLRTRGRWLFTLSLAQAGEFGFVLISFALQLNIFTQALGQRLLLVVALSMLITPLLFILFDYVSNRIVESREAQPEEQIEPEGSIIIAGIGRFGQIVNRLVQSSGYKTVVIDHDMKTIELMRRFGFRGFFGDPTRPELLHAAGIKDAKVLVAGLDDPKATTKLVRFARRMREDLFIVARAHDRTHVYELYQAGADKIVREMFDSSLRAGRYVLEEIGMSDYEAAIAQETFYHHDRETVRELAQLWDPNVPSAENEAYVKRARELEKELETALYTALSEKRNDAA
ncbi:MAG: potassium transporter [Rhodobacteraceae bacterium]|jgi:CPA2 family monovalent cation:H+ antiporter-2|uniref:Kef-type potassium/proton antiporter, CPA2 family n=1 Tax=Salipiger profundus TaxID=1229727 RepID=A0A1U7D7F3_9RHOB|nr:MULTISPECIES: monovalent cation:proton antiporter-2 (CPA2) family protein [Salipiger]APX24069.1 Kef-type potassium/proton antiporter, CPA2 family [Salipiger profundus]MAB06861.1 potassium transporter [Paracoccaceae bacterium]GFZ94458.1 potassium transporter [Salipiger profundus]SFB92060.1 Kef-type potassium/proton antiporter, CPA2 family [Salipiger profundus]